MYVLKIWLYLLEHSNLFEIWSANILDLHWG